MPSMTMWVLGRKALVDGPSCTYLAVGSSDTLAASSVLSGKSNCTAALPLDAWWRR